MPVKRYGIYLFYTPNTNLRGEGLGRHLSALLKSAQQRDDVRFAVACPSWMRSSLSALCEEEGVAETGFDIIAPAQEPLILRLRARYAALRGRRKGRGTLRRLVEYWRERKAALTIAVEGWLVGNRSVLLLIGFAVIMLPVVIVGAVVGAVFAGLRWVGRQIAAAWAFLVRQSGTRPLLKRFNILMARPSRDATGLRLFRLMEQAEIAQMHKLIRAQKGIAAWYCPTPFWPHFNQIDAARLVCVPDVVPTDFPAQFALATGQIGYDSFKEVEKTIDGAGHFVTYSQHVKWHTLVDRYHVDPDAVSVIRHGASRLDDAIRVSGRSDNAAAGDALCRALFRSALTKSVSAESAGLFGKGEFRFIFYASQFRPNKNVVSLLRAYDHLLKRRYRGHKLVLTGHIDFADDVKAFVQENRLENDVICLHKLSVQELAASYYLADLAVNPSLSEGGFPFTFTEALSVGTPSVMARIPVTEEAIGGCEFYADTTFDPYDWRNISDRIDWALDNTDTLYARQRAFYDGTGSRRGWLEMVDDYIAALDRVALAARNSKSPPTPRRLLK